MSDKQRNALKVIVLDSKISDFLRKNDPMALKQCLDALGDEAKCAECGCKHDARKDMLDPLHCACVGVEPHRYEIKER